MLNINQPDKLNELIFKEKEPEQIQEINLKTNSEIFADKNLIPSAIRKLTKETEISNETEKSIILKTSQNPVNDRLEVLQENELNRLQKIQHKEILLNKFNSEKTEKGSHYNRGQDNSIQSLNSKKEINLNTPQDKYSIFEKLAYSENITAIFKPSEDMQQALSSSGSKTKKHDKQEEKDQQDNQKNKQNQNMNELFAYFESKSENSLAGIMKQSQPAKKNSFERLRKKFRNR